MNEMPDSLEGLRKKSQGFKPDPGNLAVLVVGDNAPYSVTDASDHTIPVHGERRGLHHVAIEVRQDLIADDKGQRAWGPLVACLLVQAYPQLAAAEALRPA